MKMEKNGLKNGLKTIHLCVCKGLASEYNFIIFSHMKNLTIKPSGKSMKEFPDAAKYGNYCSGDADALHVVNEADEVKYTGTYETCRNYISWAKNTSQKY